MRNTHNYDTRSVSNNNMTTPDCNLALERFIQVRAVYLWNTLVAKYFGLLSHTNLKNYLFKVYRSKNSFIDRFKICITFQLYM